MLIVTEDPILCFLGPSPMSQNRTEQISEDLQVDNKELL